MSIEERNPKVRGIWRAVALALGLVLGWLFPRLVTYFVRLFRQPMLAARTPSDINQEQSSVIEGGYGIARKDLVDGLEVRSLADGTSRTILCAGVRNFREPWARDTGFALYGLLELGAFDEARQALDIFFLTQNDSGQFPVKVHSTTILDRFMHSLFKREQPIDQPIRPKYITAHNTISLDGNALLVVATLHYAARSGDDAFVADHWTALNRAMDWLSGYTDAEGPLLKQGAFTDWADTISRTGKILYTNVIYWKALEGMGQAARTLGQDDAARAYEQQAQELCSHVNEEFWREDLGYFVTSRFFDNLSSSGNLLAIAWGLATEDQAHRILDAMRFYGMSIPVPTKVVHRAYPRNFIAIENRLGGIADYHTYFAWLWIGAWHVIALARMGRFDEAEELVYNISRVIVRDGAVHEVYAPNGAYASTLWYTSESPLTWSAGMFVYAYNVYYRLLEEAKEE